MSEESFDVDLPSKDGKEMTPEEIQDVINKIVNNDDEQIDYAKLMNEIKNWKEEEDSVNEKTEETKDEHPEMKEIKEVLEEVKEEPKEEQPKEEPKLEETTEEIDVPVKRKHKYKPLSESEKERRRANCEKMRKLKIQKMQDRLKMFERAFLNKMQKKKRAVATVDDRPKEEFVPISLTPVKPKVVPKYKLPLYY